MKEQIQIFPTIKLKQFQNHPFQIKDDEINALCDSISEYGILSPLLVRTVGEEYEILSGHRRRAAAMKPGIKEVPAIVRDMSDEEAVIYPAGEFITQRKSI